MKIDLRQYINEEIMMKFEKEFKDNYYIVDSMALILDNVEGYLKEKYTHDGELKIPKELKMDNIAKNIILEATKEGLDKPIIMIPSQTQKIYHPPYNILDIPLSIETYSLAKVNMKNEWIENTLALDNLFLPTTMDYKDNAIKLQRDFDKADIQRVNKDIASQMIFLPKQDIYVVKISMKERILDEVYKYLIMYREKHLQLKDENIFRKEVIDMSVNNIVNEYMKFSGNNKTYIEENIRDIKFDIDITNNKLNQLYAKLEVNQEELYMYNNKSNSYKRKIRKEIESILERPKVENLVASDGIFKVEIKPIIARLHPATSNTEYIMIPRSIIFIDLKNNRITFESKNEDEVLRGFWGMQLHPHIDDEGNACYGSIKSTISELLRQRELSAIIDMCVAYLSNVNTDDIAGNNHKNWAYVDEDGNILKEAVFGSDYTDEYTCVECGEELEEDEMYVCEECGQTMCYEHAHEDIHGNTICMGCIEDGIYTWIENLEVYVHESDAVWSNAREVYYYEQHTCYCEWEDDYILQDDAYVLKASGVLTNNQYFTTAIARQEFVDEEYPEYIIDGEYLCLRDEIDEDGVDMEESTEDEVICEECGVQLMNTEDMYVSEVSGMQLCPNCIRRTNGIYHSVSENIGG